MKRASPKEVWLHYNERTGWSFSFDPPLKRHELKMHRMVSAELLKRQRAANRRLREQLKLSIACENNCSSCVENMREVLAPKRGKR